MCRQRQYLDGKAVILMEEEVGDLAGAGVVVSDIDCTGGMADDSL